MFSDADADNTNLDDPDPFKQSVPYPSSSSVLTSAAGSQTGSSLQIVDAIVLVGMRSRVR